MLMALKIKEMGQETTNVGSFWRLRSQAYRQEENRGQSFTTKCTEVGSQSERARKRTLRSPTPEDSAQPAS